MIDIKKEKPLDNLMCKVWTVRHLINPKEAYRFVRSSDGTFYWDNLDNEILQSDEVTHWIDYNEI